MTDEIFEKLKSVLEPGCPNRSCRCEKDVLIGDWLYQTPPVMVAKKNATCQTLDLHYNGFRDHGNERIIRRRLYYYTEVDTLTATEIRLKLKEASHKEGEFLAYSNMTNFNLGCVVIKGVIIKSSDIKFALRYQTTQKFKITAVKYIDPSNVHQYAQVNGFLILEGDEHKIIVYGERIDQMRGRTGATSIGYN